MPDEDKTFSGSLALDLRIWWHVNALYRNETNVNEIKHSSFV